MDLICSIHFRYEIRLLSAESTDFECVDVNECNIPEVCHRYGYCTNYPGSYSCTCHPGFVGDGLRCAQLCKYQSICDEAEQFSAFKFFFRKCLKIVFFPNETLNVFHFLRPSNNSILKRAKRFFLRTIVR